MIRSEQHNKMKFTLFAAFLFSIGWMSVEVAGDGRPINCCKKVSNTRIPPENIVDYIIQNTALCYVRAVRFYTKKNIVICSDPDSDWAKNIMKIVDWRTTTTPSPKPTCYTSTTNVILTVNTTNKTPGAETETSTITTVPTTVKTIKASRPETETSKTTILPTSVSTDNSESTAITCGTGETTATPTETKHETSGIGAVTPLNTFTTKGNMVITTSRTNNNRTKPSKLKIKILKKSKKRLRKVQMNRKNKSG